VAMAAIRIATLREQIAAVNSVIAEDNKNLDFVRKSLAAGAAAPAAQVSARAQLVQDQALLPDLNQQLAEARHGLALLVGHAPADWTAPDFELASLTLPASIPVELPSQLIRRRPDILAAEADLHAATANIGVQAAKLYPNIKLNAGLTQTSLVPEKIFDYDFSGWNFGPAISVPLFGRDQLKSQQREAEAAAKAANARYRQTVLTAFTQVADVLQALANDEAEWSFVFIPNYQATFVSKDPKNHKVWAPGVLGIHGLYINTTKKPFDNPALRKAMNMVVNREDIFNQAEAGYFHPQIDSVTGLPNGAGDAFIAPEYKGKDQAVDVEGAKKVLTDAGFKLDGTTLTDPSGKPVKITLTDPAGWSDYQTSLEIVKDNLAQIGIAATVDKANQDAWFRNVEEGKFDATFRWTNGGATPYDIYQTIMDGKLLKKIGTASPGGNFGRFDSPEATTALQAYANAADDAARTTALNTIQKIFVEQVPMIPVGADNIGMAYSTKNWVGWPDDTNPYSAGQPTQANALDVVLHLKPANS